LEQAALAALRSQRTTLTETPALPEVKPRLGPCCGPLLAVGGLAVQQPPALAALQDRLRRMFLERAQQHQLLVLLAWLETALQSEVLAAVLAVVSRPAMSIVRAVTVLPRPVPTTTRHPQRPAELHPAARREAMGNPLMQTWQSEERQAPEAGQTQLARPEPAAMEAAMAAVVVVVGPA
jgi:hypothetical protein